MLTGPSHPLARTWELDSVLMRLALLFEQYAAAVDRMRRDYLVL